MDQDLYLQELPVWQPAPEDFAKELSRALSSQVMKLALARVEEEALKMEKGFMMIDFLAEGANLKAMQLKERVGGLRAAIDLILDLCKEEVKND